MRAGDYDAAIAELSTATNRQPFNERLCGLLMRVLRDAGRHAEALTTYARMGDRLTRELGFQPGPALAALHGQILRESPPIPPQQPRSLLTHPPRPRRQTADLEAVRLLREATQLLSTAVGLLESSLTNSSQGRSRAGCPTIEVA